MPRVPTRPGRPGKYRTPMPQNVRPEFLQMAAAQMNDEGKFAQLQKGDASDYYASMSPQAPEVR